VDYGEGQEAFHWELDCKKGKDFQQVSVVGEDIPGRKTQAQTEERIKFLVGTLELSSLACCVSARTEGQL
jgi:hypothetical protein